MIIYLSFIDTKLLSINFLTLGIKNKMESSKFYTIYNSFFVKGNTTIPLVSLYSFVATDKLVRGIRNFSVAHPSEALQKSSPLEVKIGTKVNTNKLNIE